MRRMEEKRRAAARGLLAVLMICVGMMLAGKTDRGLTLALREDAAPANQILPTAGQATEQNSGRNAADARKEEKSTTSQLYAQAAVLMDAENGRILLGKNPEQVLPMASTTKIMTCILVLEKGNLSDLIPVSAYGAGQPKVHMGARKGEYYKTEDLLYSLMLESHNDAAVILAEYYGSLWAGLSLDCASHSREESSKAVLAFAEAMNKKAEEIGCKNTFFITPNGLDAVLVKEQGEERQHATTAADLARIMAYCVLQSPARDQFLKITQTQGYCFSDYKKGENDRDMAGSRSFSCNNHNAFLQMMEGALSGKTGFTGKAGYCYVGALQREGKTFTVALLACGWPDHKTWKWHDTKLLMEYGLSNYEKRDIFEDRKLAPVPVESGQRERVRLDCPKKEIGLLLSQRDRVEIKWEVQDLVSAPVKKGQQLGRQLFFVNDELYTYLPIIAMENVPKITYDYCVKRIIRRFLL